MRGKPLFISPGLDSQPLAICLCSLTLQRVFISVRGHLSKHCSYVAFTTDSFLPHGPVSSQLRSGS
ncbi:hypothetical protein I79_006007 [Cricetulus griseus]|uniref:Uncharacterized protein n=1 Tax=Cricetulus griseus TaxID=10029 RepID=G3H6P0_CRIGR|nr:hypothetical protein I79_006007 [Cricetulus griseus]